MIIGCLILFACSPIFGQITINFSTSDTLVIERDQNITINFQFSEMNLDNLLLDLSIVSETATKGEDYMVLDSTVSLPRLSMSLSVDLFRILEDTLKEDQENFKIIMRAVSGGAIIGEDSTLTVEIIDDDILERRIYWTTSGNRQVQQANLDGENIVTLFMAKNNIISRSIELDLLQGKVYWTSEGGQGRKIQRANLDGSEVETIVDSLELPNGLALDLIHSKIYWAEETGKISRANLDGSNPEELINDTTTIDELALDLVHNKIYWAVYNMQIESIRRANLDGTEVEIVIDANKTFLRIPQDIVLDLNNDHMYWLDAANDQINRSNLNGDSSTIITLFESDIDVQSFQGLDIDYINERMYWTDFELGFIFRANLEGKMLDTLIKLLPNGVLDVVITKPVLAPSVDSLIAFTTPANESSGSQSYYLKSAALENPVEVSNLGSSFEVSLDNILFTNQLLITSDFNTKKFTGDSVKIYVRLKAGLEEGLHRDTIIHRTFGGNPVIVTLNGDVTEAMDKIHNPLPDTLVTLEAEALSSTEILLTWNDSTITQNSPRLILERSQIDANNFVRVTTLTSDIKMYIDQGLNPFTTHFYRLKESSQDTIISDTVQATTKSIESSTFPLPPVGLVITEVSNRRLDIAWQDQSNNELGFIIFRKEPSFNFVPIDTTVQEVNFYTDMDLKEGTTYSYFIRSYNNLGISGSTNVVTATTLPKAPVLLTPSNVQTLSVSSNRIDLNWLDNSNNEQGFIVERFQEGQSFLSGFFKVEANTPFISDTDLQPNTTYFYRIRAFAGSDTSVHSNWSGATTGSDVIAAISESEIFSELKLYPNPSKDLLHIQIPNSQDVHQINLVDALGITVLERELKYGLEQITLDVSTLPSGLYYIKWANKQEVHYQKFIKY